MMTETQQQMQYMIGQVPDALLGLLLILGIVLAIFTVGAWISDKLLPRATYRSPTALRKANAARRKTR